MRDGKTALAFLTSSFGMSESLHNNELGLLLDETMAQTCSEMSSVHISAVGGPLIAAGNAAPNDMESFRSSSPRLYNGRALAIVKSMKHEGDIIVKVESAGMPTIIKHIYTNL